MPQYVRIRQHSEQEYMRCDECHSTINSTHTGEHDDWHRDLDATFGRQVRNMARLERALGAVVEQLEGRRSANTGS